MHIDTIETPIGHAQCARQLGSVVPHVWQLRNMPYPVMLPVQRIVAGEARNRDIA